MQLSNIYLENNLELLANQAVEGFISGMHKSPFHGFSSEFAEHAIYNQGESTKHIDWKLFAKTDKLYTKRYEEETNLRCHIIIDNSASMHYPKMEQQSATHFNKIGFSVLATACIMNLLKKQRDAVGLSIYGNAYEYYAPEKGSDRHHHMLLNTLSNLLQTPNPATETKTYAYLHQIAEKIHRRSLIVLFTDMFQQEANQEQLFEALRHLKYNKHEVVLFHTVSRTKEIDLDFGDQPSKFKDVETGEEVTLHSELNNETYKKLVEEYFENIRLQCAKYKIKYVKAEIEKDLQKILYAYLSEKHLFV